MWSCHDFLLYRIRLLQPGYRSDTCLPACCVLGCFLQSRSWNGGFIMYMQRTSNSTRWGFNLPSDQFCECFKWPRWRAPMMLFLQKCLSIWNPFGPHYSRFLDRHCCSTRQSSKEVCSSFFCTFMAKIPEGISHTPLNQCFRVSTESRGVKYEVHVHCVCEWY